MSDEMVEWLKAAARMAERNDARIEITTIGIYIRMGSNDGRMARYVSWTEFESARINILLHHIEDMARHLDHHHRQGV